MTRKIKLSPEKRKEQEKKIENLAEENYSYYILIRAIRGFLDSTTTYLKLKNQIEKNQKIIIIKNEMIDFKHKEWLDIINRFFNFILKKYPNLKNDFDFKVMDDNKKVVDVTTLTVRLHTNDYRFKYASCAKSKYPEVRGAINFLFDILGRINTITECVNSKKLKIDINERKTIKTILTRFNKYLRPTIIDILEER